MFKTCARCQVRQPLVAFGIKRQAADGRNNYCKDCVRQLAADRREAERKATGRTQSPNTAEQRRCSKCRKVKQLDAFYFCPSQPQQRSYYCKQCASEQGKENYRKYKQTFDAASKRYREQNKSKVNAWRRLWRHGLTDIDMQVLEARSQGFCEICRKKPAVAIDHDDNTGKVRGLLCISCNNGLGLFGDSVEGLRIAIAYLEMANAAQIGNGLPGRRKNRKR